MSKTRGLSQTFMRALMSDTGICLNAFLLAVKKDNTLSLEIRENYINIYYRGGNLIKIEEKGGKFSAAFDRKYILCPEQTRVPAIIHRQDLASSNDVITWITAIPFMKQEMDWWFSKYPKDERESQQLMVRENNLSRAAKGTDYFICDIEYANYCGRFDLIAAHWPSTGARRKVNWNIGLAFLEMKYSDKSMGNSSGIYAHVQDMARFYRQNLDNFAALKEEMRTVFNQKVELGLINNQKQIESFSDDTPDFILILANHDPASEIFLQDLKNFESEALVNPLPFKLKFATSNFMGYGLYEQNIFGLEDFMHRFSNQIFTKS